MPTNVEEIAVGVRAAIERLPHDYLTLAGECVDEAATQLHRLSLESNAPELSESVDDLGTSRENLDRGLQVLDRIREILELYLASIGVRPEVSPLPKPEFPAGGPPNRVKNLRGDHYPPEAASMATHLPKRVSPGVGERTVGVPRIGGRELPAMPSGRDETWSPAVSRRLREIGIRSKFLDSHVEMKLAAIMIDTRQTEAELAINYTPCGVEQQRAMLDVCHRVLEEFLPIGYTLIVYGTTQSNEPFRHTYRGRA